MQRIILKNFHILQTEVNPDPVSMTYYKHQQELFFATLRQNSNENTLQRAMPASVRHLFIRVDSIKM